MAKMVSVIIPTYKEKNLWDCLVSIRNQTYKDKEMIVIKDKPTPVALNEGIKQSQGDIIIRCDAHAWYPPDYIEKCVYWLNKTGADNVGGNMVTLGPFAKAMSFGGLFRRGTDKITEVDTVWGGCYRREVFDRIGMFDERLNRCQDIEFNLRLKRNGGKIMLCPEIISYYQAKTTIKEFLKHAFIDGIWATYILRYGIILKPRHYFPLFFVLGLLVMAWVLFMAYV